jgi:hypothetical protein
MKVRITATSSLTLSKDPRRIAWWVMIPKNTSTRFSQEPEVGVKCRITRGFLASQELMSSCLWCGSCPRPRAARAAVGLGDDLEEVQELCLAVLVVTLVGHLAGRDLGGGEQRRGPVAAGSSTGIHPGRRRSILRTAVLTPSSIATAIASTMTGVWMAKPSHA